jgi:hypothetical protein
MIPAPTFLPAATRRLVGLCPMLHVVWPSDSTRVCLTIPVPPPPPPKRLPEAQLCMGFTASLRRLGAGPTCQSIGTWEPMRMVPGAEGVLTTLPLGR